jgi:hypothetical protein
MRLFTKPPFRVELGDTIYPSRILDEGMDARPSADVIEVPGEYKSDFVNDIDQALRDIAGIATYGVSPLIHNRQAIQDCITSEIEHPFTREVVSLDERNDITLDQYFLPEKLFIVRRSTYIPKIHPASPRFVHVDIGLTGDCAGIACVHPAGFKEVRRMRGDGTYYIDKCPKIYADFMLRILPPSGAEIDISKIRSFIISLRDHGLPIVVVSCDGFASQDLLQLMRKLNFESNRLSIDRNDEPYLFLRQTIVERRLMMYKYNPVIIELTDLERDIEKRKVDHPKTSNITGLPATKDVSDSLCGAVTTCIIDPRTATSEGLGQEVYEDGRPRAGGYVIPEVTSASGSVNWSKIEEEARR